MSSSLAQVPAQTEAPGPELRKGVLGYWGVFAQSVANIGPSGAPLVAIPVIALSAGLGTWLSFVIATVGVVAIGLCIKAFARDSAGTGALGGYISRSLGSSAGVLGGWALAIAYIGVAAACIPLFAYFINILLEPVHLHLSPLLLSTGFAAAAWYFAWKDIRLSAHLMLVIELVSLAVGFVFAGIVLFKQGTDIDTAQFTLSNLSPSGIALGLVLAFMAFVGFESAASIGDEARKPLKTIPKAIFTSSVLAAVYFVVWSYVLIAGFRGLPVPLAESAAPVNELADAFGVPALAYILTLACTVGGFAVVLASINAGARSLHQLAEQGVLHEKVAGVHKTNRTPHTAVTVAAIVAFVPAAILVGAGVDLMSIWAYLGSICTFGFLLAYLLVAVGAPVHLHRKGELKARHIVVSVVAVAVVLIPFVGSVYPVPAYPYNILVYIFLGIWGLGFAYFAWRRRRDPHLSHRIQHHVNQRYDGFAGERLGRAASLDES